MMDIEELKKRSEGLVCFTCEGSGGPCCQETGINLYEFQKRLRTARNESKRAIAAYIYDTLKTYQKETPFALRAELEPVEAALSRLKEGILGDEHDIFYGKRGETLLQEARKK